MENLNNVPSTGTFGGSVSKINSNFDLVVNAINSLEYQTTRSKGILNYGQNPATVFPNAVAGDWCMILSQGNVFPATIKTYNGSTWSGSGTWNPDGVDLTGYATTSALNTAVANSLLQATARMGYGVATASGNDYSVTITNYTLPANGGVVRVKMPTAATGAATLNITDTGAKTIWYNGLEVTSENTWGAGEVISVYYDGTKYMASNSQGGGGAASKIKYDNSQSGLSAENVQAAIDEIDNNDYIITDVNLNNLTIRKNHIKTDNTWHTTAGYHAMIYVEGYSKVSIKANSSANSVVELLKSAARTGAADVATGAARTVVPIDSIMTLDIPSDAKYLYVIFGAYTSYPQKPDYVKLYSAKFNKLNDKLDNYTETSYAASSFPNAGLLLSDGTIQNNSTTQEYRTSDFIPVDRDMMLIYKDVFPVAGGWVGICVYDYQKQLILPNPAIGSESVNNGTVNLSQYEDVSYVRVSTNAAISDATTSIKLRKNYTLGDIADIIDDVSGNTIIEGYGCTTSSNASNPTNILYMSSNTPCLKSGIVEKISGTFKYAGTAVITTGFIDQNGFMITGKEYNVTIPSAGFNSINVEDKGIIINEGEFLLAKFTGNCYPNFGVGASSAVGLSVDLDSKATVRADNVYFSFAWYVKTEVPDYETLAYNVSEQKTELDSLQETVSNIDTSGVITDQETGIPYTITIRNGQIVLVPVLYKNVLVLGNSITSHEQTSIWPANNRGMAATKPEYDFCGIMQTQMRLKDNSTVVTRLNIAEWERDFTTSLSTLIGNNLTSDTDLVVIRLGENVTNNNGFGNALNSLLTYIYGIAQNAKVIVTSMFWANSTRDEILKNFSDSHGLTYVKINQFGYTAYEEAVGHYTYNTDFTAISEITNSGVAQHPSNKGMCAIANEILNAIGYDRSTNTYSLQSVTVGGVTGTMWVLNE